MGTFNEAKFKMERDYSLYAQLEFDDDEREMTIRTGALLNSMKLLIVRHSRIQFG